MQKYFCKPFQTRISKRYLYIYVIAVLFMIAKRHKQSKCLSVDEWIKKIWHICAVKYYSDLDWKETPSYATT